MGLGFRAHHLASPKGNRLEAAAPAKRKRGEGDEWWKAGAERG